MAKTLAQKLFIKPGYTVAILNAPEDYQLTDLPEDVTVVEKLGGEFDIIQYFTAQKAALAVEAEVLKAELKEGGNIWICYPKGGDRAKIATDLNRDILWEFLEPFGLAPNHQISIDETWSALRFKVTD